MVVRLKDIRGEIKTQRPSTFDFFNPSPQESQRFNFGNNIDPGLKKVDLSNIVKKWIRSKVIFLSS